MFFVAGITGAKINSVKPLSKKTGEHEISYQALPRFPEQNVERNSTGKEGDRRWVMWEESAGEQRCLEY